MVIGLAAMFLILGNLGRDTQDAPKISQSPEVQQKNGDEPDSDAKVQTPTETSRNVPIPDEGRIVDLPPVRDVTPEAITPGPKAVGPTLRLPDPPPPAKKPRKRRFFRVIVADAGTIQAKKITIKLEGVKTPDLEEVCVDSKKRKWRCGLSARGALRRLIRIRAIECPTMPVEPPATISSRCTVGPTDIAKWLVTYGWAEPEGNDDDLEKALAAAKEAKRGMWR